MMECPKRGEHAAATNAFANASGSIPGDYGKTAVSMVCPNCRKVVDMKVTTANLICPECKHKIPRWTKNLNWREKRQASQRKTISLSELDVARVLCAMRRIAPVNCYRYDDEGNRCITPEGWPMPSRLLMQQIAKLL